MTRVVPIAIACCSECFVSFDLDEWRALELVGEKRTEDPPMHFEKRKCAQCGHVVSTRVDGLEDMDLYMPQDRYAELFGSGRRGFAIAPSWWQTWGPTVTLAGIIGVAVVLVAVVVLALVGLML